MTATKEDLAKVERKVDKTIDSFTQTMNKLADRISEQTVQVAVLCKTLANNEEKYRRIESNQIEIGKKVTSHSVAITELSANQANLKERQKGLA